MRGTAWDLSEARPRRARGSQLRTCCSSVTVKPAIHRHVVQLLLVPLVPAGRPHLLLRDSVVERAQAAAARRELLLLRVLESAVRVPARRLESEIGRAHV